MNLCLFKKISSKNLISKMILILSILIYSQQSFAEKELQSIEVDKVPLIDGNSDDNAWIKAPVLTTYDPIAGIDITLQSVHTQDSIYMLVQFPDKTENRKHKLLTWVESDQRYITGKEREDTFVFKWNMLPLKADISLSSDSPYKADIWYWKSSRTDHAGFADDKFQSYQLNKRKKSRLLISKQGNYFYLLRRGDDGGAAYKLNFYIEKISEIMLPYEFLTPTGSRADIMAKGIWKDGKWTIEFQRALDTKHSDDLQFDTAKRYYFGVSRYEIAGRPINNNIEQPKFGYGDVNEIIALRFLKK